MTGSETMDAFSLDGRVAVVTGASSGLGEEVARSLAGAGARVALVARRIERLEALASELGGHPVACDLMDAVALDDVVSSVVGALGPPEILVNVAGGMFCHEKAENEPLDAILDTLRLNLVAPFLLCQAAFPHMRDLGRGSIVNVTSISGIVGVPGIPQASYAASKGGLAGLSTELAMQWARDSVRVNTLAPGYFRSEITDGMYQDDKSLAWLRRNTPLPLDGTAGDIAGAVLWLASDAGRYVTGQTIIVDGGWTAR